MSLFKMLRISDLPYLKYCSSSIVQEVPQASAVVCKYGSHHSCKNINNNQINLAKFAQQDQRVSNTSVTRTEFYHIS